MSDSSGVVSTQNNFFNQRKLAGKQDGFLAEVSPRTEFGASVLLETNEPILLCMLLGYMGVIMVSSNLSGTNIPHWVFC